VHEHATAEGRINLILKRKFLITAFILIELFYTASIQSCFFSAGQAPGEITEDSRLMLDTVVSIRLYGSGNKKNLENAFRLIDKYENQLSTTVENSDIYRINSSTAGKPVKVSEDTIYLLEKSIEFAELSNGLFNPAVGPLVKLWGIGTENAGVPGKNEITEALKYINYKDILIDRDSCEVTLRQEGMSIDLGGIAKGWIADKVSEFLVSAGEKHFLINLGGNIAAYGGKPEKSGTSDFRIGVQDPFGDRGNYIGIIPVNTDSIVSSGIYERFFIYNGKKYHHILNTETGYPVENSLAGVTVVSGNATDADALSTTLFAMGLEKGRAFIESWNNINNTVSQVKAVFITKNHEIYYAGGKGFMEITQTGNYTEK